jgi:hypothetical protein
MGTPQIARFGHVGTDLEVSAIRAMYRRPVGKKRGLGLFLARWFAVSHSLITEIKQGRSWKHIA